MKTKNRVQWIRLTVQSLFFVLLVFNFIAGFMMLWSFLLIGILLLTILFGNFFCGWICPFGTIQEWLSLLGSKIIKRKFRMPAKAQRYLQFTRYVVYFLIVIPPAAGFIQILSFNSPFNGNYTFMGLAKFLSGTYVNGTVTVIAAGILLTYLGLSLFFERPFCNYLCPDGVKYGLTSFLRVFSIRRNGNTCAGCKKCDRACPMNIAVSKTKKVRHANCINCMRCVSACPVPDTLRYRI